MIAGLYDAYPQASSSKIIAGLFDAYSVIEIGTYKPLVLTSTHLMFQRGIMGAMTVDEIYKDRKKFSNKVFDIASTDLFNMGIQVRDISSQKGCSLIV